MDNELPTFEGFFEDQKERLLRILSIITGSRAEAEDLAQEAFTRVFEVAEQVHGRLVQTRPGFPWLPPSPTKTASAPAVACAR